VTTRSRFAKNAKTPAMINERNAEKTGKIYPELWQTREDPMRSGISPISRLPKSISGVRPAILPRRATHDAFKRSAERAFGIVAQ
jgi:hypothetical protein